jgi:hypothetical protein
MGRRVSFVASLGLLTGLGAEAAQAQRTPRTIVSDFGTGISDMFYVWKAPLRADSRDWATAAGVAGTVVVIAAFDGVIQDYMLAYPKSAVMRALEPMTEDADPPLMRLGGAKVIYPMTLALYGGGFLLDSRPLRQAAMGCVTAYQAQSVVHELTYRVVSRRRPRTSIGNPYDIKLGHGEWEVHSFYTGHAANFLTCATVWNTMFDLGIAEPVLYALGVGIGIGRTVDQRHWSSDTALGLVMGYAVGRIIGGRYQARADERRGAPAVTASPNGLTMTGDGRTMVVGWRLTF